MRNPRTLWAVAYISANLMALAIILPEGQLMGDLGGFQARSPESLLATAFLLSAAIVGLLLFYNLASRTEMNIRPIRYSRTKMGVAIACVQVAFILYVQQTGLFIAGSSEKAGSLASAFWVLFNTDAIFIIYYGACRDCKLFRLNLLLWTVSFIQRGWFAYIFFIIAVESFRVIRERRLNIRKVLLLLPLIAIYPLLDLVKVYIRVADVIEPAQAIEFMVNESFSPDFSWTDSVLASSEKIVSRIQVISHAQAIGDNRPYFQGLVDRGELVPFWKEGIAGIIWDKVIGEMHRPEAAQALASFIAPDLESSWNVNPSLIGWLVIYENLFPFALLYLLLLCSLSVVLGKLVENKAFFRDVLWFIWLSFVVPGWIAQFVSFLLAMVLYIVMALLLRNNRNRSSLAWRAPDGAAAWSTSLNRQAS